MKNTGQFQKLENQVKFNNKIVTEITKANKFFRAEEYHQKYIKKQKIFV